MPAADSYFYLYLVAKLVLHVARKRHFCEHNILRRVGRAFLPYLYRDTAGQSLNAMPCVLWDMAFFLMRGSLPGITWHYRFVWHGVAWRETGTGRHFPSVTFSSMPFLPFPPPPPYFSLLILSLPYPNIFTHLFVSGTVSLIFVQHGSMPCIMCLPTL